MHVIEAENVNHAYTAGMNFLADFGEEHDSRAGKVLRSPVPVTTIYAEPCQRVLFNGTRDCNPFFHLFESIWMLAGRQDVESLLQFNKRMGDYSDDGKIFHGAYGYRWRHHFGSDQIETVVEQLKENKEDRRAMICMWDVEEDSGNNCKDIPCNDMIKFDAYSGKLNMIVFCRSNDIIWGAYGANAVHMSFLQEYMAAAIGIPVGTYSQISCDYHAYKDVYEKKVKNIHNIDKYALNDLTYQPLVLENETANSFLEDCEDFYGKLIFTDTDFTTAFFKETVMPMYTVHKIYKGGKKKAALGLCENIYAPDWKCAAKEWIERRIK